MPTPEPLDDDSDLLAAEMALRLLDAPEEAAALQLAARDDAFRAAIDRWEARIIGAIAPADSVLPDEAGWSRLAARLSQPANPVVLRRVRRWQLAALGSGALAAMLAAVLAITPLTREALPAPVSVAQLATSSGDTLAIALYNRASGKLRVRVADVGQGAKVPELWIIPREGAPRSLGTLPQGTSRELQLDETTRKLAEAGATLAITLEAPEGAPHAAPSGKILGKAPLAEL